MSATIFTGLLEDADKIIIDKIPNLVDRTVLKLLLKKVAQYSENGRFNIDANSLAVLEGELYDEIKKTDYNTLVDSYIKLFNVLDDKIIKEQVEINKLKASSIREFWDNSKGRAALLDKVFYDLGSSGMKDVFVKGLVNIARDINFTNMTTQQAVNLLELKITQNSYTQRYIRSTVFDALNQYDGAFNNEIREQYDLKNFIYVGNTIETSRAICIHLRNDLNGRFSEEKLKQVLNEYCPNGKPSDSKIKIDGKTYYKGGGMIEGTTFENFMQLRGGHGCRHRCLSTR